MPDEKPVTKTDLDQALSATTEEFKKIFVTKDELTQALSATKSDLESSMTSMEGRLEQLLADQATVILDAVDERLDKRFGEMMTGIDKVLKEVQAHREEDVAGASQLHRHDEQLQNHERRLNTLEASTA